MRRINAICLVGMLLLTGCGKGDRELEREANLRKEILESRGVDLSKKVSLDNAVLVEDEANLRAIANAFMEKFAAGDTTAAFSEIKKIAPWSAEEFEAVQKKTVQQITMMKPRFGNFVGYEFVKAQHPSPSVLTLLYLAKCENHALRCRFVFYKPKDKWCLNSFVWDDQLTLLD